MPTNYGRLVRSRIPLQYTAVIELQMLEFSYTWIANYTRKLKLIWGIEMINVDIILHFIMIEATLSHIYFCLLSSNTKICKICKYEYVKGFPAMLLA